MYWTCKHKHTRTLNFGFISAINVLLPVETIQMKNCQSIVFFMFGMCAMVVVHLWAMCEICDFFFVKHETSTEYKLELHSLPINGKIYYVLIATLMRKNGSLNTL